MIRMEINKIVKKIDDLQSSLYNAVNDDMDYLCNKLCQDLDIYKRGVQQQKDNLISQGELKRIVQHYLSLHIESKICQGITSQNNRCTRKAKSNSSYCQLHINKYRNLTVKHERKEYVNKQDIVVVSCADKNSNVGKTNMRTKFLDDKFYHIDEKYIYEKDTLEKVGYIKINENGKSDFILTDDPFILEEIMQ